MHKGGLWQAALLELKAIPRAGGSESKLREKQSWGQLIGTSFHRELTAKFEDFYFKVTEQSVKF